MSDHLDYIRIRGLEDSKAEVFQGIGAAAADTTTTPITAPAEDTTRIADALEKGLLTTDDNDELQSIFAKPLPEAIKTWMASCESFLAGSALTTWIDNCWATDAANVAAKDAALTADPPLPVPVPTPMPPIPWLPTLPVLPPTGPTDLVWQVIMYFLKRYIVKLVQEFLRKLIGKLPGVIERPPDFNKLLDAIGQLKYNDEEIDLGAFRMYLRSKIIES